MYSPTSDLKMLAGIMEQRNVIHQELQETVFLHRKDTAGIPFNTDNFVLKLHELSVLENNALSIIYRILSLSDTSTTT